MPRRTQRRSQPWWQNAVMYQAYPRSWADSNDDGIGDLAGIRRRLHHLAWLGVDALWLNPVTPSPDDDWGYDVSDYTAVHPELGTMDELEALIAEAARAGIRVILDLVPNHTSDRHPWFQDALRGRDSEHRDWYVWADPAPDGGPPNNWVSVFGGDLPAWTFHEETGQYYLHNFLPTQPDLNWWNDHVRDAFDGILRFWFDRGVAGFRIDVAHAIVKDSQLRDNLPSTEDDHPHIRRIGQKQIYNMNRPEGHDVLKRWRTVADSYDAPRVLIGETFVLDLDQLIAFYGTGADELHLAFNFPFAFTDLDSAALRSIVETIEASLPAPAWPLWMGSNHDIGRFPTRWCDNDPVRARLALVMLLTLRGTVFLYYGDEIGMTHVAIPDDELKDPVATRSAGERGRDPCRTPMQWSGDEGAGFTAPGIKPWLPFGDFEKTNVEDQKNDRTSMLNLCRDLIALRKATPDIGSGEYETVAAPTGVWAFRRGRATTVALNMNDHDAHVEAVQGRLILCTDRDREGESVVGTLTLRPWEAAVVS